jgi:CBS domain-containing protein
MILVRTVMSTPLVSVEPAEFLAKAAWVMGSAKAGSALVMDAGSLVGIFTERDIMRAFAESPSADVARVASVSAWMTPDPVTVAADSTVGEALDLMLSKGFRHLPVMDGDEIVGVVSMRDLAQALSRG